MTNYLLLYDISENAMRTRIHKIITKKQWTMLQYSVYIKYTTVKDIKSLEQVLEGHIDIEKGDSLLISIADTKGLMNSMYAGKIRMYLSDEIEEIFI